MSLMRVASDAGSSGLGVRGFLSPFAHNPRGYSYLTPWNSPKNSVPHHFSISLLVLLTGQPLRFMLLEAPAAFSGLCRVPLSLYSAFPVQSHCILVSVRFCAPFFRQSFLLSHPPLPCSLLLPHLSAILFPDTRVVTLQHQSYREGVAGRSPFELCVLPAMCGMGHPFLLRCRAAIAL